MSNLSDTYGAIIEFRPPDMLFIRASETRSSIEERAETFRKLAEQRSYYIIVDFTGVKGSIDSGSREQWAKAIRPEWILGSVFINASLPVRMGLKVINLGLLLTGKGDFPTEYVTSEAEALATVERYRAVRAAKGGA
jgi:hypothetical protein